MVKDKRYITVKNLISGGFIKFFNEIFDSIPKSVIYKDLGMNNARFNHLMDNVEDFALKDLFKIAELIEIDEKIILELIYHQHQKEKRANPRNKK